MLDRWNVAAGALEVRLTQGPADAPVLYVNIEKLADAPLVEDYLSGLEPFNEEVVVMEGSEEVTIQGEYAEPLVLKGKHLSLRKCGFEAADFERDAKSKEELGNSMHQAWQALSARVGDARHLLEDQKHRLLEKAARHPADSTARQLYEQQVSFIDRVLSKLDT